MSSTRLTKSDLKAIEYEVEMLAGPSPTLESIKDSGHKESRWLSVALDTIAGIGRVITLLVAESIQALAALVICIVFALLEYWRVAHGAAALGQSADQAGLIAFAVVTANIVHPIYALRQLRGQTQLEIVKMTGRGLVVSFIRRAFGKPVVESVDLYHNPTLHIAAAVITWSTVVLAVYDILGPLLTDLSTGSFSRPPIIMLMELLMGLGLSIAGVYFLQSAAHEIGVRTLTDQPQRLADVLEQRQLEHQQQIDRIRDEVRERYIASKMADMQHEKAPFGSTAPTQDAHANGRMNSHANGHGGDGIGQN